MRLDFLERYSEGDGPLHRLDPRVKLLGTLLFVVAVVATPVGWWRPLAGAGLALALAVGATIVAKNSLAFLAMLLLANVTPYRKLIVALRRLGAPPVLVATLQFM